METALRRAVSVLVWAAIGAFVAQSLLYNPVVGGLMGAVFGAFFRKGCGT